MNDVVINQDLHEFGIFNKDDYPHSFDPSEEWWNESWFWDWINETADTAGHFRLGFFPGQKRVWIWLHLFHNGEWVVIEEPRLSFQDIQYPRVAYHSYALSFSHDVIEPLLKARLCFDGYGRVVSGERTGHVLHAGIDFEISAAGVPYCTGRSILENKKDSPVSIKYDSSRYEQPVKIKGKIIFGRETISFSGSGERDHSWGPRPGKFSLNFLAAGRNDLHLQCLAVPLGDGSYYNSGYVKQKKTVPVDNVVFDLDYDNTSVLKPVSGNVCILAGDGTRISGSMESLTGTIMDYSHTCEPPDVPMFRRVMVKITPDDGSHPLRGWFDYNVY